MRSLSTVEKATFERDGVVLVRGAVPPDTIEPLLHAVDRIVATPIDGLPEADRASGMSRRMYAYDDEFARFVHDLGLATLAAQATDSTQIRIYFDQIFVKAANSGDDEFPWHQDHPYWPIGGRQVVSTWLALTPATADTSALEFVKGSHEWGKTFRPAGSSKEAMNEVWDGFGDLAFGIDDQVIDFENHPASYDVVGFSVEPGDALLFDYRILHRSRGNPSANRRVAVSWRWLGDDATWEWRRGTDPVIDQDDTFLEPGQSITDDATFPVVYPAPG